MPAECYYIGLMSGTSLDAADAVLAAFARDKRPRIVAQEAVAPDPALRRELLTLSQQAGQISLARLGALDQRVGAWFADAALAVMATAGIDRHAVAAIGSHGQTVRHEPEAYHPFSMQIGAPSLIAARTGCTVVAGFRNSDMAVGGQGAPLVCAFHRAVFADTQRYRMVVNIGGIANLTVLSTATAGEPFAVTGFDTGPGNGLMDAWIGQRQEANFDADGAWAASGQIDGTLLDALLADDYFRRLPPKSTGREYFNLAWVRRALNDMAHAVAPVDVQATLCELSARTIGQAITRHGPGHEDILLCGGGVHNTELRRRLTQHLAPRAVEVTDAFGVPADWVEALAFAWLARQRLLGAAGNAPGVTGARQAVSLGGVYLPPPAR